MGDGGGRVEHGVAFHSGGEGRSADVVVRRGAGAGGGSAQAGFAGRGERSVGGGEARIGRRWMCGGAMCAAAKW